MIYILILFNSHLTIDFKLVEICMKGNYMPQLRGVEPVSFVKDLSCFGADSL